jgi:hypothetical protein
MRKDTFVFAELLLYGARIVGVALFVIFLVDMWQFMMNSRHIIWGREIEMVLSGLIFFIIGSIALKWRSKNWTHEGPTTKDTN